MNLAGNTPIVVNGRTTRILSHHFNVGLRKAKASGCDLLVLDIDGAPIFPSKGLSWTEVGAQVRAGKKVQASCDKPTLPKKPGVPKSGTKELAGAPKPRKRAADTDGVKGGSPIASGDPAPRATRKSA